jgi:hypothetical protein
MTRQNSVETVRDEWARADRQIRAVVRQRPFVALTTAIAAGFVFGRIFGRR